MKRNYTIDMTSTTQTLEFPYSLHEQTIILRNYEVHFELSADQINTQVLFVNLPFLNSTNLIDPYIGKTRIPILLCACSGVSVRNNVNMPIYIQGGTPNNYQCSVEMADGSPVIGFGRIVLNFEFTSGHY